MPHPSTLESAAAAGDVAFEDLIDVYQAQERGGIVTVRCPGCGKRTSPVMLLDVRHLSDPSPDFVCDGCWTRRINIAAAVGDAIAGVVA
jgi:hypothetical protein